MSATLTLAGVGVTLGRRRIVSDVGLSFTSGRFVVLIGPNGAGKSTLLKAIAGLVAHEGEIALDGREISALSPETRARRIAYLPQGHQVHWPLNARDVVALGRYPHGMTDPSRITGRDAEIVAAAMARMDVTHLADKAVTTLSGGERARVMLARVLAVEAPLILADEPTAALDPRHQITVMSDLAAEAARGSLVIAVTHDLALAARMADEMVLVSDGRIVARGRAEEVLTESHLRAVYGVTGRPAAAGGHFLPWDAA